MDNWIIDAFFQTLRRMDVFFVRYIEENGYNLIVFNFDLFSIHLLFVADESVCHSSFYLLVWVFDVMFDGIN